MSTRKKATVKKTPVKKSPKKAVKKKAVKKVAAKKPVKRLVPGESLLRLPIEISDLPRGWIPVAFRRPKSGEYFFAGLDKKGNGGGPRYADFDHMWTASLIIKESPAND